MGTSTTIQCVAWNIRSLKEGKDCKLEAKDKEVWKMLAKNDVVFISETNKKQPDDDIVSRDDIFDCNPIRLLYIGPPQETGGGQLILYNSEQVILNTLKTRCDHFVVSKIIKKETEESVTEKSVIVISCYLKENESCPKCKCEKSHTELLAEQADLLETWRAKDQPCGAEGDLKVWTDDSWDDISMVKTRDNCFCIVDNSGAGNTGDQVETWGKLSEELYVEIDKERFDFGDFRQIHCVRPPKLKPKASGGQMIVYNSETVSLNKLETRCDHFVVSEIIKNETGKRVIVISCYMVQVNKSCHACNKSQFELLDELSDLLRHWKAKNQNIVVVGDLNVHTYCLEDGRGEIKTKDKPTNVSGAKLAATCEEQGFCIVNGRADSDSEGEFTCSCKVSGKTRESVIDYLIVPVNRFDPKTPFSVSTQIPNGYSDHKPLIFSLALTEPEPDDKENKIEDFTHNLKAALRNPRVVHSLGNKTVLSLVKQAEARDRQISELTSELATLKSITSGHSANLEQT